MTSRWLICFSVLAAAVPSYSGTVTGRVELRDSRDAAVKNRHDYSGVVISLKPLPGTASRAAATQAVKAHAVITQKDKTFSPHVLAIPLGTYVDFPNIDPIFHNAFSSYSGQVFDVGLYPPGTTRAVRFTREGVVRVFCNIHSSMSAMIVVLATPYFAVSKKDGSFEIAGVPPGEYELRVMHERASEAALEALTRRVSVTSNVTSNPTSGVTSGVTSNTTSGGGAGSDAQSLPSITVSEAGYLSIPHKNKYGQEYPPDQGGNLLYPGKRD